VRTAQFGGSSSGNNAGGGWQPGSSPFGKGSGNSGGSGMNRNQVDEGLDAMMSRTHMPMPLDPERNMEKRLEPMHAYIEDDSIPYHLTLDERMKLKVKREVRRRERALEQASRSIDENTPAYINKHFPPKPEHMVGIEATLESRRVQKPGDARHPREDVSPPLDRPTRIHPVMSDSQVRRDLLSRLASEARLSAPDTRTASEDDMPHGPGRMSGDGSDSDDDTDDPFDIERARNSTTPLGRTPLLTEGADLDQYMDAANKANFGDNGLNMGTHMDQVNPDQVGYHEAAPNPYMQDTPEAAPHPMQEFRSENDTNLTTEQKLKGRPTVDTPKDPYRSERRDEWTNQGDEPQGVADKYHGGGAGTTQFPTL
jgi:hypothetical protein